MLSSESGGPKGSFFVVILLCLVECKVFVQGACQNEGLLGYPAIMGSPDPC